MSHDIGALTCASLTGQDLPKFRFRRGHMRRILVSWPPEYSGAPKFMDSPLRNLCGPIVALLLWAPVSLLHGQSPPQSLGDPISLTEAELDQLTAPAAPAQVLPEGPPPGVPVSGFTIDRDNRNCVAAGYHLYYSASEGYEAVMGWTGNVSTCTPGTVSAEFQDKTLRRINYYRAQTGLPSDIAFDATKNADSQEAAVIMAYQNQLSHTPDIDFPTNPCLTSGGTNAAAAGNLSLGSYGPGSIDRLILDTGSNNAVAGHRRWLLYLRAQEMGNGSVPPMGDFPYVLPDHPSADCVWVIGDFKPAPQPPQATAWPNDGFVPWQLVPDDGDSPPRWSYTYPGADFSAATVTMTQGATPVTVVQETVESGFGDPTLVWRPAGIPDAAPAADTTYTVTISGITGTTFTNTSYDVTVVDPFRVNDPPVITGPANPAAGIDNTYHFTATDKVEAYELCTSEFSSTAWLEGAETSPAPQIIDNTDPAITLLSSAYAATGSRAFHLTLLSPDPVFVDQDFVVDRTIVPQAGSQIRFSKRRFFMLQSTKLHVELSLDGTTYTSIHTVEGQMIDPPYSSDDWDPAFTPETVNVPAEFIDKSVTLRFRIDTTGSAFPGPETTNNLHIDDIEVTNSSQLLNPTMQPLADTASSFDFNPPTAGRTYRLAVRPQLGGHWFGYGPSLDVTSVTLTAPVITSLSAAKGVQGAAFSYSITATNSPTSYNATGLPAGAAIDTGTGEITGQIPPGVYPGITISATNAAGTGNAALTITVLTGFEKWVADNYPGLGPPTADDDHDKNSNFLESAILGMNPTQPDAHLTPGLSVSGGNVVMTMSKSGVAGLDYTVQGSPNMAPTSWSTSGITIVTDNATTLQISFPFTGTGYFLRLVVTQNNDTTL